MFQFLYGAIGSINITTLKDVTSGFQFLYGAIGRRFALVWLSCLYLFQFLYGAIGSITEGDSRRLSDSFNSFMVRLED